MTNHKQATNNKEQTIINNQTTIINIQRTTNNKQPQTTDNKHRTTNNKQQSLHANYNKHPQHATRIINNKTLQQHTTTANERQHR